MLQTIDCCFSRGLRLLVGGANVCQETGLLLPTERRSLPSNLRPHPGTEHPFSHWLSFPASPTTHPGVTCLHARTPTDTHKAAAFSLSLWLQFVYSKRHRCGVKMGKTLLFLLAQLFIVVSVKGEMHFFFFTFNKYYCDNVKDAV